MLLPAQAPAKTSDVTYPQQRGNWFKGPDVDQGGFLALVPSVIRSPSIFGSQDFMEQKHQNC
jgi:hypothetical protein